MVYIYVTPKPSHSAASPLFLPLFNAPTYNYISFPHFLTLLSLRLFQSQLIVRGQAGYIVLARLDRQGRFPTRPPLPFLALLLLLLLSILLFLMLALLLLLLQILRLLSASSPSPRFPLSPPVTAPLLTPRDNCDSRDNREAGRMSMPQLSNSVVLNDSGSRSKSGRIGGPRYAGAGARTLPFPLPTLHKILRFLLVVVVPGCCADSGRASASLRMLRIRVMTLRWCPRARRPRLESTVCVLNAREFGRGCGWD